MVPKDADIKPCRSLWWPQLMTSRTGVCAMWLAWIMECVWSMVGLWLCCGRKHMVLVGNDNDKNAGFFVGSGVEEVFRRSSDISPTKVAGGNGGTEQWWGGHHRRLHWSHPLIVLQKEHDRARTMTSAPEPEIEQCWRWLDGRESERHSEFGRKIGRLHWWLILFGTALENWNRSNQTA